MKKLLSIILAILMIVTSVPFAFAAGHTHALSSGSAITFEAFPSEYISDESPAMLPAGNYYLTGNISLMAIMVQNGTVNLCLNGYTITTTCISG